MTLCSKCDLLVLSHNDATSTQMIHEAQYYSKPYFYCSLTTSCLWFHLLFLLLRTMLRVTAAGPIPLIAKLCLCDDRRETVKELDVDLAAIHIWGLSASVNFNPSESSCISSSQRPSSFTHPVYPNSHIFQNISSFCLFELLFASNLS